MLVRLTSFSVQRCGAHLAPAIIPTGLNLINQSRSTWVLRRKWPPPLLPSRMSNLIVGPIWRTPEEEAVMPEDHMFYEVDEENMTRKVKEGTHRLKTKRTVDIEDEFDPAIQPPEPNLKLILIKHVEDLGAAGSVVDVPAKRARNELILRKEAVYASPFNMEWYADLIANSGSSDDAPSSPIASSTRKTLSKLCLGIEVSQTQNWEISKMHIRRALRNAGIHLASEDCIELPKQAISGPNIEELEERDFVATVIINNRERAPVRCRIRHIGLPFNPDWNRGERDAVFPEDASQLATLPIEKRKQQLGTEEALI